MPRKRGSWLSTVPTWRDGEEAARELAGEAWALQKAARALRGSEAQRLQGRRSGNGKWRR